MSTSASEISKLAVIGAGNMGSGIAQKIATEGFEVVLVDLDDDSVARGLDTIRKTLDEGVERKLFKPDQAKAILGRVRGTTRFEDLADVDLAIEAVFEDLEVKQNVFRKLDEVLKPGAVLATNTSSFLVRDVAAATNRPERVIGLHYFYHPAKNRLVEVVPTSSTDPEILKAAHTLQERIGKTPIASADAPGFVVNRYFVPWLNEAVRLLDEGVADIPTIEAACKQTFGVGMGPFELMNVTGVPIALHAATTLGNSLGAFYAPCARLAKQVDSGDPWPLTGEADEPRTDAIAERMLAVVFYVVAALVDEKVGTIEETDIGARVGLRWPRGPFQMMNRHGVEQARALVARLAERWELDLPRVLTDQAAAGKPFAFEWVRSDVQDGVARLTINRPDAMNALNESVVGQLHDAFRKVRADDSVKGIVIAGAGKAFIAGADIRFFVRNIDAGNLDRIVTFTEAGHALLREIDNCEKPVIARLHGLALGGGLELALACDKIVATPRATMAFPETGIGIYPGLGGTQRTPRRIGKGLAKWLIYTGQMLDAADALAIGLIDRVVPHEKLDDTIRELIEGASAAPAEGGERFERLNEFFASNSVDDLRDGKGDAGDDPGLARAMKQVGFKAPIALGIAERLIDEGSERSLDEGLKMELNQLMVIFGSSDAYEGLSSLGKRRPVFKGR